MYWARIRTLDADVNVVLLVPDLDFSTCVFGFRERIEGLEVLNVCGHKTERGALLVRGGCVAVLRCRVESG